MSVSDPRDLPQLFAERVSAGDIEGVMALYEDGATLVGPDGVAAAGKQAIRERLEQLLATTPRIAPTRSCAMVVGDIALMSGDWKLRLGAGDGGGPSFESTSTEVARRQRDGSWLYVIDDPASTVAAREATRRAVGARAASVRAGWPAVAADELPYIDAHSIEVNAPAERVWADIVEHALRSFGAGMGPLGPYATRLGGCPYVDAPPPGHDVPETIVGFRVARAERPSLIVLTGWHRFARYSLTLRVEPVCAGEASRLT
ncbi:MAG TPA: nuclear transport factor 2 family protein, partial [Solirubrobacteraceae bacterium]|nr:nuclear transport factor 2 family protein [Solirubrobacteraceae bacterium]